MASNIIGVFDTVSTSEQVVNDLVSDGFDSSSVRTFEGSSSDLENQLLSAGIDAADAREYASSVGREGALIVVTADESRTERAVEIMNGYYTSAESDSAQYAVGDGTQTSSTTADEGATFQVAEEQLQIGKREVQRGGVRVRSVVTERPVEEQVTLRDETVRVERHPVDRAVDASDTNVFNEQTVELTETDEEAVVAKETHVIEEVTIGKEVGQRTETISDTVRRVDVDIEELGTAYGESLAGDERYATREWDDIEPEARADWERTNQDKASWDEAKGGIRGAWDRLRGKS